MGVGTVRWGLEKDVAGEEKRKGGDAESELGILSFLLRARKKKERRNEHAEGPEPN